MCVCVCVCVCVCICIYISSSTMWLDARCLKLGSKSGLSDTLLRNHQ